MLGSPSLEGRLPALRPSSLPRGSPHQVGSSPFACTFEPHLQGSYLQGQNWTGLDCTQSLALRARLKTGVLRGRVRSCKGWWESHVRGCLRFYVIRVGGGWGQKSSDGLAGLVQGSGSSLGGLLFFRCFFLVLRHTPGTPGTGLTSLLLTGGGCRMGLGARVRQTGSPAAQSRIPVIPARHRAAIVRGRGAHPGPVHPAVPSSRGPLGSLPRLAHLVHPGILGWVDGVCPTDSAHSAPPEVEAKLRAFCRPRPPQSCSPMVGDVPSWPRLPRGGVNGQTGGAATLWAPPFFSVLDWTSPARAGWTGPVPFKFFTGSAGTLRGEEKRL